MDEIQNNIENSQYHFTILKQDIQQLATHSPELKQSFQDLPELLEAFIAWVQGMFVLVERNSEIDVREDVEKEMERLQVIWIFDGFFLSCIHINIEGHLAKLVVLCALYVTHKAVRLPINLFSFFHICYQVKLRSTNRTSKGSWKKLNTSQEQIVSRVYKESFIKLKELWTKLLACLEERLAEMEGLYSSYLA